MTEYAEHFHSPDGELRCYEPSAASGTGWRPAGISFSGSHPQVAHRSGKRRHGPYDRSSGFDAADGCDHV